MRSPQNGPKGIILSGGPSSVTDEDAPRVSRGFLLATLNAPILGICYGMQLVAVDLGGTSEPAARREYGHAKLKVLSGKTALFNELPFELDVWMSHGDHVTRAARRISDDRDDRRCRDGDRGPERGRSIACSSTRRFRTRRLEKRSCEIFFLMFAAAKAIGRRRSFIKEEIEKIRETVGPDGQCRLRAFRRRRFDRRGGACARSDRRPADVHLRQ